MSISRVFAAAAIAVTFNLNSAQAQSFSDGLVPAEFPPSSYKGRQYVDSEGCVYIRAGVDGNVTWVPRVTRSRKVICGFQPTFGRKAPLPEAVAPQVVASPVTVPKQTQRSKKTRRSNTLPVKAQPLPVALKRGDPACRGGNAVSQQYVGRVGENVRCGPQQGSFAKSGGYKEGGTYGQVRARAPRVVPLHVYEGQMTSVPGIGIPEGYKPAWDDDRLNPRRAHQTLAGKAQMDQVWTQTTPRKLIQRKSDRPLVKTEAGQYVTAGQASRAVTLSTRSKAVKAATRKTQDR